MEYITGAIKCLYLGIVCWTYSLLLDPHFSLQQLRHVAHRQDHVFHPGLDAREKKTQKQDMETNTREMHRTIHTQGQTFTLTHTSHAKTGKKTHTQCLCSLAPFAGKMKPASHPTLTKASTWCMRMGLLQNSTSGLGTLKVSGRKRVP